jgi:sugar lactone lactonase YvrE
MKPRMFTAFVLVASLALLLAVSTSAQRSDRPIASSPSGDLGPHSVNAPAVTLGQPGTSFRYLRTYGEAETPYLADTAHLFGAAGLFIDGSNNVYVVETDGHRLLRYNSTGTNTLSIGIAGIGYTDDYVFNYPSDAAVDNGGNIWVADNSRVVQYNFSGAFLQSLPARDDSPGNSGNANGRFDGARGLAFDSVGRMYVSDSNNHRVQVYDMSTSSPVYSTTIGVTGIYSSTGGYFNYPYRIAVDTSNRLYVVDNGNNRVQQCIYRGLDQSLTDPAFQSANAIAEHRHPSTSGSSH